jgi:hypothetical protein
VSRRIGPVLDCLRQMFREQVSGVVERPQRRALAWAGQLGFMVEELANRAGTLPGCWRPGPPDRTAQMLVVRLREHSGAE